MKKITVIVFILLFILTSCNKFNSKLPKLEDKLNEEFPSFIQKDEISNYQNNKE